MRPRHIARSFAAATATPSSPSMASRPATPVTIFNEVVLHFLECMYVHLENARPKMQGQLPPAVQTNPYMPYSGGVREYQVHFTQLSAYSGTGGQQHDLRKMVLDVMQYARTIYTGGYQFSGRHGLPLLDL